MDLRLAGRGRGRTANVYRVATYIEPLYTEIQALNLINDRVAAAPPARELDLAIGKTKNSNTLSIVRVYRRTLCSSAWLLAHTPAQTTFVPALSR